VDIPNVNTLIVHDSDRMGLSQLYQLRGRVGRSNRIAYAYFTYQRDKVLTEIAEKRLQAIKEFTELGSGFKIAMRDLSIRGAGNLLGAEQHGFIASVGFDLYSQMLAEEISKRKDEMKGEAPVAQKPWSTVLDIQLDAYIPGEYIYDSVQKIEIYKKVAVLKSLEEVAELHDELVDRFGDLPESVHHLLAVARLKIYGAMYAIETISQKGADYEIKIHPDQTALLDQLALTVLAGEFENRFRLIPGPAIHLQLKGKGLQPEESIELLERFLVQYKRVLKSKGELQNVVN
jgi:transcription-repair coupling factor (superfamily II helicase)